MLTLLALLCAFSTASSVAENKESWQWYWVCKGGKCVKSEAPATTPEEVIGTTQSICKLTCGKYGSLWPRPTGQIFLKPQMVAFHPSRVTMELSEVHGRSARDYLLRAGKLFQSNLYVECGPDCNLVPETQVTVHIAVPSAEMQQDWSTDESYTLDVATSGQSRIIRLFRDNGSAENGPKVTVKIRARTFYGARNALETLTQLVTSYVPGGPKGTRHVLVIVGQARIADAPKYPHRGLIIDTARNYLPLSAIQRTIDGMATVKLNVLHWHITDSQSFPFQSPRVPQLAMYGAYGSDQIYTPHDVAYILEYARLRGVRVIIEIDAPAHSGNGWQWGESAGLGKLAVCVNQQPWRKFCIQPPCGQLNPANPNLFSVLRDLYHDLIDILPPGEVFHMGGDEVFFGCWNSSQEVVAYLQEKGLGRTTADFLQLWADYQATVLQVYDEINPVANTPIMLWSSHLTDPNVIEQFLDKNRYVIETWVEANKTLPLDLLAKDYRIVMATKDKWYLDHGFWGTTVYHNWRAAYENKLPKDEKVLGGESAMWSELVDDMSLDVKVWPRAAAAAERLWSDPDTNSDAAEPRMQQLRMRLIRRGLRPDALSPGYCTQNEAQCF